MLIDSHLHIGLNNWNEKYLLDYLDKNKIDKAWILTWEESSPAVPEHYIPLDIKILKKVYKSHPDRIVPFYAPDPGRANWKEDLQDCLDEGFAGCAELKVSYNWDDPKITELLEFLDRKKLPLIFHMEQARKIFIPKKEHGLDWLMRRLINEKYNGKAAPGILGISKTTGILRKYFSERIADFPGYLLNFEKLEKAISSYPNVTFIGHGPHIWNHYSVPDKAFHFHQKGKFRGEGIIWRLLKQYPNFYCDISGFSGFNAINRDHKTAREFLGSNFTKILFGTDNMEFGLHSLVKSFDLEKNKLDHIFFKNALRIVDSKA